jgi:hypothetical protein
MKVFNKCPEFNKHPVGTFIAEGADGEAFLSEDKVIKFTIIRDGKDNANNVWFKNKTILEAIFDTNPRHFCKVFDFGVVKVINDPYSIIYFSLLEKLNQMSSDESKAIDSLISHRDYNKYPDINKSIGKVSELHQYLDFDKNKMIKFLECIKSSKIKHLDMHPRNVMKDSFGNFKLIDFDRMEKIK